MKLVAYLRVSTDSQVDRYGLPAQRKDVQAWVKHPGFGDCSGYGVTGSGAGAC